MLAEAVDGAFGDDGLRIGEDVRACGGVAQLAWLLADPCPEVQCSALMILGNLCSDSVDPNSRLTKLALLPNARSVLSCVYTEDPGVLCFACGALQNLSSEPDWSDKMVSLDVHRRLEQLAFHEDARIQRYATGALQNIQLKSAAVDLMESELSELAREAVKERSLLHQQEGRVQQRAMVTIAKAFAAIPLEKRRQRQDRGLRRRTLRRIGNGDTMSNVSSSTWSYEIGPFVRSRDASRPSSACSHASSHASHSSHASYLSAKSVPVPCD